jgi:uncharacterized repeat protein (TIGR01451 family)
VSAIDNTIVDGWHTDLIEHKVVQGDISYMALPPVNVTVIITDNDLPAVMFEQASYQVFETADMAMITVKLTASPWITAMVDYSTGPSSAPLSIPPNGGETGGATAGLDYQAVSGTLTFPPGTSSLSWMIPLTDDNLLEGNEIVNFTLQNPINSSLAQTATAVLTIFDDEASLNNLTIISDAPKLISETIHFTATVFGGGANVTYTWNFGDGVTITPNCNISTPNCRLSTMSHIYAAPGIYTLTVKATDGLKTLTGTISITVTSSDIPFTDLLEVVHTSSLTSVIKGQYLVYQTTVKNVSHIAATGVIITHQWPADGTGLPAFYGFISSSPVTLTVAQLSNGGTASCRLQSAVLSCQIAELPAGSRVTINLMLSPRITGTLTSNIQSTANEVDPNMANNSATVVNLSVAPAVAARAVATPQPVEVATVRQHVYLPIVVRRE